MKTKYKFARKILFAIFVLLMMGAALFRVGEAADLGGIRTDPREKAGLPDPIRQIQISTPTPIEIDLDEERPIQSEVGRDIGLIIGAAVLLLIVFVGLLIGQLHSASSKARD